MSAVATTPAWDLMGGDPIWVQHDGEEPVIRRVESVEATFGGQVVIRYSDAPHSPTTGVWVVHRNRRVLLATGWHAEEEVADLRNRVVWRSVPWFAGVAFLGGAGWMLQAPPLSGLTLLEVGLFIVGVIGIVSTPGRDR